MLWIFFFNDTATTEIYTLSLHDALPILHASGETTGSGRTPRSRPSRRCQSPDASGCDVSRMSQGVERRKAKLFSKDRKSTRLNSSHANISYAVFCLKKKKKTPMNASTAQ